MKNIVERIVFAILGTLEFITKIIVYTPITVLFVAVIISAAIVSSITIVAYDLIFEDHPFKEIAADFKCCVKYIKEIADQLSDVI